MKPAAAAAEKVLMLIVAALRDRKLIVLWGMEMMTELMAESGECSAHRGGRMWLVAEKSDQLMRNRGFCRDASFRLHTTTVHTRTTTFSPTLRQRHPSIPIV